MKRMLVSLFVVVISIALLSIAVSHENSPLRVRAMAWPFRGGASAPGGQRAASQALDRALAGAQGREIVVLLHGLARTPRSMRPMEKALTKAGYSVVVMGYPSTEKPVGALVDEHLAPLLERCMAQRPARIHFVAHSLGNILLRQYFATRRLDAAGRIVMLGPPNQGSEVADKLGGLTLYDWIHGPAGQQLGTSSNALPQQLPVPPTDVGVIAGTRSINLFLSMLIPGPDDGKVSVERARLDGMKDFATVAVAHPFLMRDPEVIAMTIAFLRDGAFPADARGQTGIGVSPSK